ncbi:Protein NLRC5 [Holothuria leucospilota]|uniref:Protein NLRC5 n=1 Tax=Holothuria leucospilota TaxID=206669 RepID=A0A9Q1CQV9_HOLLE|nr:Protein NLRC5 [Holothuria leucospilota]
MIIVTAGLFIGLKAKRSVFIKQLKGKYEVLYNSVQPIPYIRERQYCVDAIFVESGIEYLASHEGKEGRGKWAGLHSYHDILNASLIKSSRLILEGDPGYGKSIITLQLAYDWCNKKLSSPLSAVDIFILLRLRQLGGVSSVFSAIKRFILPHDSQVTEIEIKNIISNTPVTVIVLDGYDEYPDQDEPLHDVNKIIARDIFQDLNVIVTTRSSCLPRHFAPGTKRLRLTGFNDKARETYIRKAVVENDEEAAANIEQNFRDSPVLLDLCQVPLFFVLFAHMTHDKEEPVAFSTVTSFFRHIISSFHSHMKNKMEDENVPRLKFLEKKHEKLDKVAFKGLSGKTQQTTWEKEELRKQIGADIYDLYTRIGILVAEDILLIHDAPGTSMINHIQRETKVRFYHKLFCEWYAAHFVSRKVLHISVKKLLKFLQNLDPSDVQYVFRFACGLNPSAGGKIINYLKNIDGSDKFAVLCILEQEGKVDQILKTVRALCSETVQLEGISDQLFQRSAIQLLEIASNNSILLSEGSDNKNNIEIPISVLFLLNCFRRVILPDGKLQLTSNVAIPVLVTLKVLVIHENGEEITEEQTAQILHYSSRCTSLEVVR